MHSLWEAAGVEPTNWRSWVGTAAQSVASTWQSTEEWTIVAVLEDDTTVRLGSAVYQPSADAYQLVDGSLEISSAALGPDGVYTLDSGRYRVLTRDQCLGLRTAERARAEVAAAMGVQNDDKPASEVTLACAELASLCVAPAPTDCHADARKATIIAIGPKNVAAVAKAAATAAQIAQENHNVVTHVVLGAANDDEARAALELPSPRVLLAGAHELSFLSRRVRADGPMLAYLRIAKLFACVRGSAAALRPDGSNGVWVLPAAPITFEHAALAPRDERDMVAWSEERNAQYSNFVRRYGANDGDADELQRLLQAYTTRVAETVPLAGFAKHAIGLVGTVDGPPFATVERTLAWMDASRGQMWPATREQWASTGALDASDLSASLLVATWCLNTETSLTVRRRATATSSAIDELQREVDACVGTLKTMGLGYEGRAMDMQGVIGPVTDTTRDDGVPMRVVWWTLEGTPPVLMLLPEAYVRTTMEHYDMDEEQAHGTPFLCARSVIVLPEDEQGCAASANRARCFAMLNPCNTIPPMISLLESAPLFTTQQFAQAHGKGRDNSTPGVAYTCTDSHDHLCGLRVRWNDGVLDVDTDTNGRQCAREFFL